MIVDCYTHIWDSPSQLGLVQHAAEEPGAVSAEFGPPMQAGPAQHLLAAQDVDATLVLGFKSQYLQAEISNARIAQYVQAHSDKLIGFAGIDPTNFAEALEDIEAAHGSMGMKGIAVSPAAQNVHPSSSHAEAVYEQALRRSMPVIIHAGMQMAPRAVLEYAQPVLLDEVARNFPTLKIVIPHLGYPWIRETLVLLDKHENVFADVSWLLCQPWEAYQALLAAHHLGVMHKILFGSAFPYQSPTRSIETLYELNHFCNGTTLPTIPREALRGIVERDALGLLGIDHSITVVNTTVGNGEPDDDAELGLI